MFRIAGTGISAGVTWMLFESSDKQHIILTVDVEDNFTKEELRRATDWDLYESQVVGNTCKVIDFLKKLNANATFFVLGRVAERHPEVVNLIDSAGFEVASHGYAHIPVEEMSEQEFKEDLEKSISILQSIAGKKIIGFRARSFSITKKTLWALSILKKYGLVYDSSIIDEEFKEINHQIFSKLNLFEFPINTKNILGKNIALSGGIALRILPFILYSYWLENSPFFNKNRILYFHVWEFNKDQPKRRVGLMQSLVQASWTYNIQTKIKKLSGYYTFLSVQNYLDLIQSRP